MIIVLLCVFYLGISAAAWKIRNPKGNDWTFWLFFPAPLAFERIPELQVNP